MAISPGATPSEPSELSARHALLALLRDLTDGLADGMDSLDIAHTLFDGCLEHTPTHAAGILLVDAGGSLRVLAASNEEARSLELLELQSHEGPSLDAFRAGRIVSARDLPAETVRWPRLARAAAALGIREVHSLPLRLRDRTIGALNLFLEDGGRLDDEDLLLAEILASAAALGILTRRRIREGAELAEQLQSALDSRVVIEQAKGILAVRADVDLSRSFDLLRRQARHERRPLRDVALDVVARYT